MSETKPEVKMTDMLYSFFIAWRVDSDGYHKVVS